MTALVLASTSMARAAMLRAAGVGFEVVSPQVDETELKHSLSAARASPRGVADALAEAKAVRVSRRLPGALVLGGDQVLAADDGAILDKPGSLAGLRTQLTALRGRSHRLISAAVIAADGNPVWRFVDTATLTMRAFSDDFLDAYVGAADAGVLESVGGYHIEGRGAQLFARVDGDHFTIRGLPLLAVLDYLRVRGILTT